MKLQVKVVPTYLLGILLGVAERERGEAVVPANAAQRQLPCQRLQVDCRACHQQALSLSLPPSLPPLSHISLSLLDENKKCREKIYENFWSHVI